jgi:hypothetical protein
MKKIQIVLAKWKSLLYNINRTFFGKSEKRRFIFRRIFDNGVKESVSGRPAGNSKEKKSRRA